MIASNQTPAGDPDSQSELFEPAFVGVVVYFLAETYLRAVARARIPNAMPTHAAPLPASRHWETTASPTSSDPGRSIIPARVAKGRAVVEMV
jgi:hypothetical protein